MRKKSLIRSVEVKIEQTANKEFSKIVPKNLTWKGIL